MYSYSYNMYIFQDAYRDEIIFMGTFKIGLGRISGSAGLLAGFLILPGIRHVRLFGRELPDMDSE